MTDTIPRPYKINGTSLTTYRWNLVDMDGIHTRPSLRGQPTPTPYRHGSFSFGRKFYEEKFFVMRMSILGMNADGGLDGGFTTATEQLYKNLDDFQGMFHSTAALVLEHTMADQSTTRELDVEVAGDFLIRSVDGDQRYEVNVPLVSARPFWREMPLITDSETGLTGFNAFTIPVDGNAPVDDLIFTINCTSAGSSPQIEIPSTEDVITISDATLTGGDEIIIDLANREFTKNGVRYDSAIGHNRAWFIELPAPLGVPATLGVEFDSVSGTYNLDIARYNKWF
jgi:hypothetical protein